MKDSTRILGSFLYDLSNKHYKINVSPSDKKDFEQTNVLQFTINNFRLKNYLFRLSFDEDAYLTLTITDNSFKINYVACILPSISEQLFELQPVLWLLKNVNKLKRSGISYLEIK